MTDRLALRTVVCGTNFGRFYLDAVRAHPAFELVGVLARGSAQSAALAAEHRVPRYTDVLDLPDDVDAACVVVPAAVAGGTGTELATALLARGVHVLQEHPLHPDEIADCLRAAHRSGARYRVNTHYARLRPVATFLDAARRLRERQEVLFVDAAASVHVLHPLVDILGRALGSLRPWRPGPLAPVDVPRSTPIRTLNAVLAGVPLTLRVHNQIHPGDRDNHALFWHRISLGTEGGVLALADTHGPVLWHPRLHSPRDAEHRLVFTGGERAPGLDLPTVTELDPVDGARPTHAEAFATLWPDAIAAALTEFDADVREAGTVAVARQQYDLSAARIWRDLVATLGPPELITPPAPRPLPAEAIADIRTGGPADGYTGSAEFFDLAAREHTAHTGPAAVAALADVDPAAGPLLDIGAGTGLVTVAVARAFPDLRIIASEPSPAMRAILTSRVADEGGLRDRVTVTGTDAATVRIPERVCGAVLCGVAGHLDVAARRMLFARLAAALPPGAPVVVELMGLPTATALPDTRLFTARLGEAHYEWWMAAETAGPDLVRLHTRWCVRHGDALVREVRDSYLWHTFTVEQLAAEVGFDHEPLPAPHDRAVPHMAVLRAPLA